MKSKLPLVITVVILASILSCCIIPDVFVRIGYGYWPIGNPNKYKYAQGMTQEEIRAIMGPPHAKDDTEKGEKWYYYCDAFGLGILRMQFNRDGVLEFDWW